MTPPRLEASFFGQGVRDEWTRMARVLAMTAAEHCAQWSVSIRAIAPAAMRSAMGITSHVQNTQKMEHWSAVVAAAADGEQLLLLDADTFIVRSLDAIWDLPFDLAYTTKHSRFPFNSGVIAVRVNERSRAFFAAWRDEQLLMLGDSRRHYAYRERFGGINQAALGRMLERVEEFGVDVAGVPCLEWNCEDTNWHRFDPAITRIVHVKSSLRLAALGSGPVHVHLRELAKRWRELDRMAAAATAEPAGLVRR